jgi:hypothetical protein
MVQLPPLLPCEQLQSKVPVIEGFLILATVTLLVLLGSTFTPGFNLMLSAWLSNAGRIETESKAIARRRKLLDIARSSLLSPEWCGAKATPILSVWGYSHSAVEPGLPNYSSAFSEKHRAGPGGFGAGLGRQGSRGRGRVESEFASMKTKTYFAFRIDVWDSPGDSLTEHLAGLDDYAMAVAAYWAAIQSRPKDKITLRQGARVVLKSWT